LDSPLLCSFSVSCFSLLLNYYPVARYSAQFISHNINKKIYY
jgi:hypothetical protein